MDVPDVSEIGNVVQLAYASIVVVAVLVVPQVIGLIQNHGIKKRAEVAAHQLQNNSGSSVKDAIDRIEHKLTEHIDQSNARFEELEMVKGKHRSDDDASPLGDLH